jgi:hypothetical protein
MVAGEDVFDSCRSASGISGTVTVDVLLMGVGFGLSGVAGGVAVTVAVFLIEPALTSDAVVVYVAVHVSAPPGASLLWGQEIADRPGIGSVTTTGSSVTLPVLLTA